MLNELYNNLREDKAFRDLFQPASKEELEKREKERIDRELPRILKKGKCTLNPDGTYSCEGIVSFYDLNLTKLPVKFKEVKGNFICSSNQLTSLEGSPERVGGAFNCFNNQLTSLEGAPKEVGGNYDVEYNKLTSLEGGPRKVGGDVYFRGNPIAKKLGIDKIKGSDLHKYIKDTNNV